MPLYSTVVSSHAWCSQTVTHTNKKKWWPDTHLKQVPVQGDVFLYWEPVILFRFLRAGSSDSSDSRHVSEVPSSNPHKFTHPKSESKKLCRESGCFLKWWYPQNTPKCSFLVGKPMVFGYHHFRKHPSEDPWFFFTCEILFKASAGLGVTKIIKFHTTKRPNKRGDMSLWNKHHLQQRFISNMLQTTNIEEIWLLEADCSSASLPLMFFGWFYVG